MPLDVHTLAAVLSLSSVLHVVALAAQLRTGRDQGALRWWTLSSVVTALGFASNYLRDHPHLGSPSIVLNNTFFMAGLAMMYGGARRFYGERADRRLLAAVVVLGALAIAYFTYVHEHKGGRRVVISVVIAAFSFAIAKAIRPHRAPGTAGWLIAGAYGANGLLFSFRALTPLFGPVEALFAPSLTQVTTYLAAFVLTTLSTLGIIALDNQRLSAESSEARENAERIFNMGPDPALITRLSDDVVVAVNDAYATVTGYARAELLGAPAPLPAPFCGAGHEASRVALRERGALENVEAELRRKAEVPLVGLTSARRIALGGEACVLWVTRDITDRKRAEDALQQVKRKLTLLSSVTRHDINNQLTVLQGCLSVLREPRLAANAGTYSDAAMSSVERISEMIRFTKAYEEIGASPPRWQRCRDLVAAAVRQAPVGALTVRDELPAGAEVFADPLLARVFQGLLESATRGVTGLVTVRFQLEEAGADRVIVCTDDGPGLPDDEKERIFERGFAGGEVLGLSLARDILAVTGATILERGEAGSGARFELTVPAAAYRCAPSRR